MSELASNSIGAVPVFPETIAFSLLETVVFLGFGRDQFVSTMGEPAAVAIGTSSEFGEVLAKFSLMFERVSLHHGYFFVPLVSAVTFSGAAAVKIAGFLVDFGIHAIDF